MVAVVAATMVGCSEGEADRAIQSFCPIVQVQKLGVQKVIV